MSHILAGDSLEDVIRKFMEKFPTAKKNKTGGDGTKMYFSNFGDVTTFKENDKRVFQAKYKYVFGNWKGNEPDFREPWTQIWLHGVDTSGIDFP